MHGPEVPDEAQAAWNRSAHCDSVRLSGVRLLDVTGPIEVFTTANEFGGRYRVQIASEDGTDVITSAGTRLGADLSVDDVQEPCDVLVMPGGPEWETLIKDDALLDVVRQLNEKSRCTASVCTGAFLLARPDF